MTAVALTLVLASAVLHATWNFLVKRSGASGAAFVWLLTVPAAVLLAPVALWLATARADVGVVGACFLAGSAALHTAYFLLLLRGYRVGDLSLVYPLARGTGPLLASVAAVIFLGERPSVPAAAGALCVTAGAFALGRDSTHGSVRDRTLPAPTARRGRERLRTLSKWARSSARTRCGTRSSSRAWRCRRSWWSGCSMWRSRSM